MLCERERVEGSVGVKMGVGKGNISEECVGDGVYIYTLERGGVRAVFTNWGAILMSLCVPDAQGAYEHTHNFYVWECNVGVANLAIGICVGSSMVAMALIS